MTHDLEQNYDAMLDLSAGRLDPAEAEALQRRIDADPELREAYPSVSALARELSAYGDSLVAELPIIDVVDAVRQRVEALPDEDANVVKFERPRAYPVRPWWFAVAAAAALVAAVWVMFVANRTSSPPQVATRPGTEETKPLDSVTPPDTAFPQAPGKVSATEPGEPVEQPETPEELPAPAPPVLAEQQHSPQDIIKQRRKAITDEEAREVLARWAALSPEKARAIVASGGSEEAIVGAALALGGAEAAPILKQAVANNPNDPFLDLELAKATGTAPRPELDEDNALAWYVYARQLLRSEPPNLPEALRALETAQSYSKVHSYALDEAAYHEQALIASGMPADSARLVTAFTAGPSEHDELVALGMDLLEYGQYFQALGDADAAHYIIESTQRFGEQLNNGAIFSQERFAALEIQDAALQVLQTIYTGTQLDSLAIDMESVASGFNNMVAFVDNFNELLSRSLSDSIWQVIADIIVRQGDLQVFNSLPPVTEQ